MLKGERKMDLELLKIDREINDLMGRVEFGEATKEEIQFLKNLRDDLNELSQQYWEK